MSSLLLIPDLSIGIESGGKVYNAVQNISLQVNEGEIVGLVGESGCGKSLTALAIAGLLRDGVQLTGGNIFFDGRDLRTLTALERSRIQGKDISIIFQEPMSSLNPLIKIGKQVSEVLRLHDNKTKEEIYRETISVLHKVGLKEPEKIVDCYPYQLSGGMQQRVMIAMAIICKPKLLIADEATTALDVTIQAQILELLKSINRELNMAILFISHDLGVISRLCHRVAVMYAGEIVEEGTVRNIFLHPVHEYTKGLIGSIPTMSQKGKPLVNIKGRVPSIYEHTTGCLFAPRCQRAEEKCFIQKPTRVSLSENHAVSCYLAEEESEMEYVRI